MGFSRFPSLEGASDFLLSVRASSPPFSQKSPVFLSIPKWRLGYPQAHLQRDTHAKPWSWHWGGGGGV